MKCSTAPFVRERHQADPLLNMANSRICICNQAHENSSARASRNWAASFDGFAAAAVLGS